MAQKRACLHQAILTPVPGHFISGWVTHGWKCHTCELRLAIFCSGDCGGSTGDSDCGVSGKGVSSCAGSSGRVMVVTGFFFFFSAKYSVFDITHGPQ